MKRYLFFTLFLCFLFLVNWFAQAQNNSQELKAVAKDVETIDNIITALYQSISGEKGQERDWPRFRSLFLPDAKLIPSGKADEEGTYRIQSISVEDYITASSNWFQENGFFENEIHRETATFSHLTHIMSTYESRYNIEDEEPFARGINSIQLFNDGFRWWIVNIYWATETEDFPIPAAYLPQSN